MVLDLIYISVIVLLGVMFISLFRNDLSERDLIQLRYLFFFHLALGFYYCYFIKGDAIGYWRVPKDYTFDTFKDGLFNGEGTMFMYAFNFVFSNLLNMSYLANTLLYSLFGFMGLTFFYLVAVKTIPYNKILNGYILFPLIFFLPNLHFWSAGVGKDSILFLCIGMFFYGILKPFTRIPLLVISLLLAMAIRPHIVLFLSVGFGLAYIMGGKISLFQRIVFSIALIGIGIAILPSVMEFAKIEEASVEGFDKFADAKAEVLSRSNTGSALDVSAMPFPLKVLTFWFRPFFFDARNLNGFIASIENLILVVVFIKAMRTHPFRAFMAAPFVIKGMVVFLILGTLAFSQSLGNVGIMIRMRNMFLPGMLIFLMWCFSYQQQLALQFRNSLPKKMTDEDTDEML
ncbi:hypothetical protein J4771_06495 [Candidatus Kaistella beijingensis]|uniref:hypothetical protein n=1 Tax=Candidatus Kaistella beijingensis TaxID=2820270 RepID=UPI001CC56C42|nr:hypothetical protein [Candidatus Kaistella beijingensis]UBB90984.1 hypothetical protein J4771_06495 [Candidatus Kaistella beijingensis]